jgi:hypothetical protein
LPYVRWCTDPNVQLRIIGARLMIRRALPGFEEMNNWHRINAESVRREARLSEVLVRETAAVRPLAGPAIIPGIP